MLLIGFCFISLPISARLSPFEHKTVFNLPDQSVSHSEDSFPNCVPVGEKSVIIDLPLYAVIEVQFDAITLFPLKTDLAWDTDGSCLLKTVKCER